MGPEATSPMRTEDLAGPPCRMVPEHQSSNARGAPHASQLDELAKALRSRGGKRPLWFSPALELMHEDLKSPQLTRGRGRIVWLGEPEVASPHGAFAAIWDTAPHRPVAFLPKLSPLPGEYVFSGLARSGVVLGLEPLEPAGAYADRYTYELDRRQRRTPEERAMNAEGNLSASQRASAGGSFVSLLFDSQVGALCIGSAVLATLLGGALLVSLANPKQGVHSPLGVGLLAAGFCLVSLISMFTLLWRARASRSQPPERATVKAAPHSSGGYRRGTRWLLPIDGHDHEIDREVWEYLVEARRYDVLYRKKGRVVALSLRAQ